MPDYGPMTKPGFFLFLFQVSNTLSMWKENPGRHYCNGLAKVLSWSFTALIEIKLPSASNYSSVVQY